MQNSKVKLLFYAPVDEKYLKNWEFYKPDIDVLKKITQLKVTNTFFQFLKYFFYNDYIYCVWWGRSFPAILISKIFRKKIFCSGAIHFEDKSGERTWYNSSILNKLTNYLSLKLCNKNIFVSKFQQKQFKKHLNITNGFLIKLKLSMRLDKIKNKIKKKNKKKKLILTTILWHTRSSYKRKGFYETLDAIEKLNKTNINFEFNVIGANGNGLNKLQELLDKKKLREVVKIYVNSSFNEKVKILKQTHLYIQPSYCESFGYAVLEASACNTLSLISKNNALREIINEFGFITKKINSQSIYYSILNYYKISLKDEKLMISKLQDHVRKNYSIFKHEIEIQNLLKSVH